MAKKQRPKWHIPVLCAALLALAAVGLGLLRDPFPRLEVGGYRISEEEYLRVMYQARNDVLSDHAAVSYSLTDWSAESPLGDPRRLTMERALELLTEAYAVDTLAVERGYLSEAGYDAMKTDMERINRERQEALDSGGMVTGFASFTVDDYMSYRASSLRLQFCTDPDNPEYQVTEQELLERYEADRDNLYQQPDSMELAFVALSGGDDSLEQELLTLRAEALALGGLSAALDTQPRLKEYYQEISVTPATYSTYARSHGDILAYSDGLQTGDLSEVIRREDWLCLIECRERIEHSYVPLEDVRSVVEQSVRESRYDALIASRMETITIRGDLQKLYRFTAEQLP